MLMLDVASNDYLPAESFQTLRDILIGAGIAVFSIAVSHLVSHLLKKQRMQAEKKKAILVLRRDIDDTVEALSKTRPTVLEQNGQQDVKTETYHTAGIRSVVYSGLYTEFSHETRNHIARCIDLIEFTNSVTYMIYQFIATGDFDSGWALSKLKSLGTVIDTKKAEIKTECESLVVALDNEA